MELIVFITNIETAAQTISLPETAYPECPEQTNPL
jgi:hypothetical protein